MCVGVYVCVRVCVRERVSVSSRCEHRLRGKNPQEECMSEIPKTCDAVSS